MATKQTAKLASKAAAQWNRKLHSPNSTLQFATFLVLHRALRSLLMINFKILIVRLTFLSFLANESWFCKPPTSATRRGHQKSVWPGLGNFVVPYCQGNLSWLNERCSSPKSLFDAFFTLLYLILSPLTIRLYLAPFVPDGTFDRALTQPLPW